MKMKKEEQKIVVAVDESEESMYALSWCLENLLPHSDNTTLVLLYVKPPPTIYALDAAGLISIASHDILIIFLILLIEDFQFLS